MTVPYGGSHGRSNPTEGATCNVCIDSLVHCFGAHPLYQAFEPAKAVRPNPVKLAHDTRCRKAGS